MPSYEFDTIYTLEARGNVMLDLFTTVFDFTGEQIFNEIHSMMGQLRDLLGKKGITYSDLKRALVPDPSHFEQLFVFDYTKFPPGNYAINALDHILPHLSRKSTCSILAGDWIHHNNEVRFSEVYRASFGDNGPTRLVNREGQWDTLFFVYINNLARPSARHIDNALSQHPAFLGSVDLSSPSVLKAVLSTMLRRLFIQHSSYILMSHSGDEDGLLDIDELGIEAERFGYKSRSVPDYFYDLFLSYKIERRRLDEKETDGQYSLLALSSVPCTFDECKVVLDERKYGYLIDAKEGSMRRTGLLGLTPEEIAQQIRSKLADNYVYNLARAKEDETLKFNILLEHNGSRFLCALKFAPHTKELKVLTLF